MRLILFLLICFSIISSLGCASGPYAQNGALAGGMIGAPVGAIIGANNGEAGAGALIGGAIGALSGSNIGSNIDQQNQANAYANSVRSTQLGLTDVIGMSRTGLGDDVIMTQIQTNGVIAIPTSADLITLKNAGVSDRVIQAMQTANIDRVAIPAPVQGVIVEEHFYGPPVRFRPAPQYYSPRHYSPRHYSPRYYSPRYYPPGHYHGGFRSRPARRDGSSITFSHRF